MADLKGKRIFMTGGSRGIGEAIALRAARDGAMVAIAAKTVEPHPNLPGTIYTVAEAIEKAGGKALPLQLDARDEDQIDEVVSQVVKEFGGLDILINNCSAISLTPTLKTEMKRYDLMMGVNVRATFACSRACLPHLMEGDNPHILTLSPPLNMEPKWFKGHVVYTMSKYGMSMCTLGMAEEFKEQGVAVNSLWPRTTIATAAIANNFPKELLEASRKPEIVADAAHLILTQDSRECTGNFFVDDEVLAAHGVTDLDHYAVKPGTPLYPDFFL